MCGVDYWLCVIFMPHKIAEKCNNHRKRLMVYFGEKKKEKPQNLSKKQTPNFINGVSAQFSNRIWAFILARLCTCNCIHIFAYA